MRISTEQGFIKFGDAASIERYLERRCGQEHHYLKEKGVLHLVAKDFANESISTKFGDMPFNNKLVLILTDSEIDDSNSDIISHSIMPVLTTYLKEYEQANEVEQFQGQNDPIPYQKGNQNQGKQNHFYYVVLAIIGVTLSVFAASSFGSSSNK